MELLPHANQLTESTGNVIESCSKTSLPARNTRQTAPMELTESQRFKLDKQKLLEEKQKRGIKKPIMLNISAGKKLGMNAIIFDDDKPTTAESEELDLAGHSEEDLSSESDDQ